MPRSCVVKNCKKPSNYKLPKNREILKKWEEILGLDLKNLPNTSIICKNHFQKSDLMSVNQFTGKSSFTYDFSIIQFYMIKYAKYVML